MSQKICFTCKMPKDTSEYYAHPQTADRLCPSCKRCMNAATNRWRRTHKDRVNEMARAGYRKRKARLLEQTKPEQESPPEGL